MSPIAPLRNNLLLLLLLPILPILLLGEDNSNASVLWRESFAGQMPWTAPAGDNLTEIQKIHSVIKEPDGSYLKARYDVRKSNPNPPRRTMHFGKVFADSPIPLQKIKLLKWRWRVHAHPSVADDPWLDVGAGIYILMKKPSLFWKGKGFKFAWLSKPGAVGTKQHGIIQIALRSTDAVDQWFNEEVDLCGLFTKHYGSCNDEHVLYIGVETDADGTKSFAEGHYTDFELISIDDTGNR